CTSTSGGLVGAPSVSTFSVMPADTTRRLSGSITGSRSTAACGAIGSSALHLEPLEFRRTSLDERADTFAEVVALEALRHQLVRVAHRFAERERQVSIDLLLHDHQRHRCGSRGELADVRRRFGRGRAGFAQALGESELARFDAVEFA